MNDEAQVPEDQTEGMTERQMDGVSGGGSPLSALQAEVAAMEKLEQTAIQGIAAAEQAEVKELQALMNAMKNMNP